MRLDCLAFVFITFVNLTAISLAGSKYLNIAFEIIVSINRSRFWSAFTVTSICNQLNR